MFNQRRVQSRHWTLVASSRTHNESPSFWMSLIFSLPRMIGFGIIRTEETSGWVWYSRSHTPELLGLPVLMWHGPLTQLISCGLEATGWRFHSSAECLYYHGHTPPDCHGVPWGLSWDTLVKETSLLVTSWVASRRNVVGNNNIKYNKMIKPTTIAAATRILSGCLNVFHGPSQWLSRWRCLLLSVMPWDIWNPCDGKWERTPAKVILWLPHCPPGTRLTLNKTHSSMLLLELSFPKEMKIN